MERDAKLERLWGRQWVVVLIEDPVPPTTTTSKALTLRGMNTVYEAGFDAVVDVLGLFSFLGFNIAPPCIVFLFII